MIKLIPERLQDGRGLFNKQQFCGLPAVLSGLVFGLG